ncbi:hypothetical protein Fuma_05914 [Fuerstiella marisgermanici]|uniref:Uncharacterized protein n=1 Tax=Fuerstiella marisgermanici TaxID=1891926 RepID=A0A1P8WQA3_9PLAN|nr:hypothetical protein Fuma_05914 [Fuerstiella marisgermanici]
MRSQPPCCRVVKLALLSRSVQEVRNPPAVISRGFRRRKTGHFKATKVFSIRHSVGT